MTTYNRAQYIEEAIESVIASTYKNWELIIVDDCSTDNTEQLVMKYLVDNRIQYHRNEKNLGQFPNRNKAASLAKGKYIKYLDSDDMIYPHGLQVMVNGMLKYPEAGLGIQDSLYNAPRPLPYLVKPSEAIKKHLLSNNYLDHGPTSTIIKKECFEKVGGFIEKYGILSDSGLNLNLASKYDTILLPKDLAYWRIHDEQITIGQKNHCQMAILRYYLLKDLIDNPQTPIDKDTRQKVMHNINRLIGIRMLKESINLRFGNILYLKKQSKISKTDLIKSFIFKTLKQKS